MATQHRILVPIVNTSASLQAIALACTVGKQRRSKIIAVHVIEVLRSLPLNAEMDAEARRGEQLLRRAEEMAHAHGFQLSGELLQAREAGQAIVDEAREREIDTVALGIGYKRVVGEFQVGRTATFVLRHAPCEVWIVRQGLGDGTSTAAERE